MQSTSYFAEKMKGKQQNVRIEKLPDGNPEQNGQQLRSFGPRGRKRRFQQGEFPDWIWKDGDNHVPVPPAQEKGSPVEDDHLNAAAQARAEHTAVIHKQWTWKLQDPEHQRGRGTGIRYPERQKKKKPRGKRIDEPDRKVLSGKFK